MPLKSKIKRIIDTAVNFILITLAISVIVLGSALPFQEQTMFLCMAIYILLKLKYGRSISELNYILSLLISVIIFYALKFGLLSSISLGFYFVFILLLILLSHFIIDREILKIYLSPISVSIGIICIFFYLISMIIKLNLSETRYYLIPTFCLLVFLHLAIFKFKPEKSKKIGIIFVAVLVCSACIFLFRYVSSAYLINKGSIEKAKGNITSALSDYKKSISLLPFDARNHYMLAVCYEAGGFKAEALNEYQKITHLGSRDGEILAATYVRLSELYLYNRQWKDTYMSLVKLVVLKASNQFISAMSEPIKNLYDSILFEYQDNKKEAIEKIKTYLNFEKCKDDDCSHYRLAKLYRTCGETDLAKYEYNKAVDSSPNEFIYRLDLAYFYLITGGLDKSIEQYIRLLKIRPDSFEALEGYADALLSGGYRADALLIAEEIKKRYPDCIIVHEILAKVYSRNGFSEKALAEYKEFFKKTPVNPQTLRILGDYYLGNCEFEKALKTYLRVIKLNPDIPVRETIKMLRETDHKEFMQRELISLENMSNQQPQDTSLLRKYWFLKRKLGSYRSK